MEKKEKNSHPPVEIIRAAVMCCVLCCEMNEAFGREKKVGGE